jgi:hypothetical protein
MCAERQVPLINAYGLVIFGFDVGAPFALYAVESQKVSGCGGSAFKFVKMHHFESIAGSGIIAGPFSGAHCCAQGQTPNPPHAIDAYFHAVLPEYFDVSTTVELIREFKAPM